MSPPSSSRSESESSFTFLPYGALIQEFTVDGHNIVLSLPTEADYKANYAPFFGATIGRTTNRIRNAQLSNLNNRTYQLRANDPPNSLHGGPEGWHSQTFAGPTPVNRHGKEGVLFTHRSPNGAEGYPGTLECRVYYTASKETTPNGPHQTVLDIEHEVHFVGSECASTVTSVTNHSYFSVSPPSAFTIAGTLLTLGTPNRLDLDAHQIPTGTISRHPSCPPEPNTPIHLTATSPSFDDCFVFDPSPAAIASVPLDTRSLPPKMAVRMHHPETKLTLEIWTTEPSFQVYTGEGIDVPALPDGKGGMTDPMGARKGIAVEPGRFVDAAGREEWRGMCEVSPGEVWGGRSRYVCRRE